MGQVTVRYMNFSGFPLTMGRLIIFFLKCQIECTQEPFRPLSVFHPETLNSVAKKQNVNIYKALSIVYPVSFSYALSSFSFLSPCSLNLLHSSTHLLPFPNAPTSISPKSVHPETAFTDGKEKALDKAPI